MATREAHDDVARRFGRAAFVDLVKGVGLTASRDRCECPLEGCQDKRGENKHSAHLIQGKASVIVWCHRCSGTADYVQLYAAINSLSIDASVEALAGAQAPAGKPQLRLVRQPILSDDSAKISVEHARQAWSSLAVDDDIGMNYLAGRQLQRAAELGYVRFAIEGNTTAGIGYLAKSGYRCGVLLADLAGQPRGIQFRNVAPDETSKLRSIKGSHTSGVYFGRPGDVIGSLVVVVAEGMADSLAALQWVEGTSGTAVIGVPGVGQVKKIAAALEDMGVDVGGQTWVLLAQRDSGPRGNQSLAAFSQLAGMLRQRGADVILESEPTDSKDWAEAWGKGLLPSWPPPQLSRLVDGGEIKNNESVVRLDGAALVCPTEPVDPGIHGRDSTTLTYLLGSSATRIPICGPGDWALNMMSGRVEYAGRPMTQTDWARAQVALENFRGSMDQKRLKFTITEIQTTASMLADLKIYHPVDKYLKSLVWDGEPRIAQLSERMGLPDDAALEREYLRRWLMSACARATRPGCKADAVLVLQGAEGVHKSTFFEIICGLPWFARLAGDMGSKDAVETLRPAWIVELDELSALSNTKDFGTVKAFLSRPHDDYVPKYIRESIRVGRTSVFGGSINPAQFLADDTGDRRFWVIHISQKIDLGWIEDNRDQIWAESMQSVNQGDQWWLTPDLEAMRESSNSEFRVADAYSEVISDFFEANPLCIETTMHQVLDGVLKLPIAQMGMSASKRVAGILRTLGWANKVKRDGKKTKMVWMKT